MPKSPKITTHRVRVPYTANSRFYDVQWEIRIDGAPFARCTSIYQSWRCWRTEGGLQSGDFATLADAKAWGLEMARRHTGLSAGPVESRKGQYGEEVALDA